VVRSYPLPRAVCFALLHFSSFLNLSTLILKHPHRRSWPSNEVAVSLFLSSTLGKADRCVIISDDTPGSLAMLSLLTRRNYEGTVVSVLILSCCLLMSKHINLGIMLAHIGECRKIIKVLLVKG
jgi:hypothetical protein